MLIDGNVGKSKVEEIVTFLKSLTGEIPEDALKVPLLPLMDSITLLPIPYN